MVSIPTTHTVTVPTTGRREINAQLALSGSAGMPMTSAPSANVPATSTGGVNPRNIMTGSAAPTEKTHEQMVAEFQAAERERELQRKLEQERRQAELDKARNADANRRAYAEAQNKEAARARVAEERRRREEELRNARATPTSEMRMGCGLNCHLKGCTFHSRHDGVDIWHDLEKGRYNTPVYAITSGTVKIKVRENRSSSNLGVVQNSGNYLTVTHSDGEIVTGYMHLKEFSVEDGAKVRAGDQIGIMGTTSWSTGEHLHLYVRVNGMIMDPEEYFKWKESKQ